MLGVAWGEYLRAKPGSAEEFAAGVNRLVAAGLKPPPPLRYPLADGSVALRALADGAVFGKVVLEP